MGACECALGSESSKLDPGEIYLISLRILDLNRNVRE